MRSENGFSESGKKTDIHAENSYGGFQYRWNYEEYQRTLARRRRKAAGKGMWAFCFTALFVFVLCFVSLIAVLTVSVIQDDKNKTLSGTDTVPSLTLERQHTQNTENTRQNSIDSTAQMPLSTMTEYPETDLADVTKRKKETVNSTDQPVFSDNSKNRGSFSAFLGIYGETVSAEDADLYHIPQGVKVNYVNDDGMEIGFVRGDIITTVDGISVSSVDDLTAFEDGWYEDAHMTHEIGIFRDGKESALTMMIP